MKNIRLFQLVLPLSIIILLLTCVNLGRDLKAFRVANKGIRVNTKISAFYLNARWRRGLDYYADFRGEGVNRMRRVSEQFYKTHQVNDEVVMKYLPDEDVILFDGEQRGGSLIARGIFVLLAIGILIAAVKIDRENEKKKGRIKGRSARHHKKRYSRR